MIEKQGERISPKTMWIHNSNNSCTDLQSHNFIPTSNKYYNNFGIVFMPKISMKKRVQSTSLYTKTSNLKPNIRLGFEEIQSHNRHSRTLHHKPNKSISASHLWSHAIRTAAWREVWFNVYLLEESTSYQRMSWPHLNLGGDLRQILTRSNALIRLPTPRSVRALFYSRASLLHYPFVCINKPCMFSTKVLTN